MKFYAVMCVWNEEDIVEATIKHLFAQGFSKVFVIDNDSTDGTVTNALKAGAELAATFKTAYFSEDQKIAHLNAAVKYINEITPDDQIWWLYVDADEFPHIEGGLIVNYLNALDSSIRAIDGHMLNHAPTHPPYYIAGFHPADFQPLCGKSAVSKAPLLRYDKGKPHLWSIGGAHDFITHGEVVPTLRNALSIHHFPLRAPQHTYRRLKKLVERNTEAMKSEDWHKEYASQISKLDMSGYESRYKHLARGYEKNKHLELKTPALIYDYKNLVRWYALHVPEVNERVSYEENIWLAIYYFFMGEYDLALCRFNDIFDVCDDAGIKLWLMAKMAECLEHTGSNDSLEIMYSMRKYGNSELNAYIDKYLDNTTGKGKEDRSVAAKIYFYESDFAPGVEERCWNLMQKIEPNISRTINKNILSKS